MNRFEPHKQFPAKSDAGESFSIVCYREVIEHRPLSGKVEILYGVKDFKTSCGKELNFNGDESNPIYTILDNDIELTPV